ncbi:hypothetical protein ALC56_10764, partial [Trachymyrmex septentrionalis]
ERENWSERAGQQCGVVAAGREGPGRVGVAFITRARPPPRVRPLVVVLNGNDGGGGGGGGGGKGGESKVGCWSPPPYVTLARQVLRGSPRKNITAFSRSSRGRNDLNRIQSHF